MATIYKHVTRSVAKLAADEGALDGLARKIEESVIFFASEHVDSGHYAHSIKTEKAGRGKDRLVTTDDPNAYQIEWGHAVETEKGPVWVPGQYIFTKTMGAL
ncbi:DUF5403 family protein [Pseudoclavibacter alba]|uniref:DUF5403 family protein n=1 Tax=Pseudoclavibacter albus TaxID=272241 RepID=UPI0019D0C87D|nr:DUF5403 family protein [Pseudoclavibacter alba]MBN6777431.1 DUF5403 family protein [Pseudoclavibacter alba]